MLLFSGKASTPRRWVVLSVLTFSVCAPAVPDILPDSVVVLLSRESVAWAASTADFDSGAQLSQAREYMERQRVAQQLDEDRQRQKTTVKPEGQKPAQGAEKVTFTLTKVETDPSEILTEAEIRQITEPYVGKKASLQDLYDIAEAINGLYEKKGYAICRAYLPPQRIQGGAVQIKLLEGKTGKVTVDGLRFTRQNYVTNRIKLEPGKVANTDKLN